MAIANNLADLQPPNDLLPLTKSLGVWCEAHKHQDKADHIYFFFSVYQMETPA